MIHQPHFDKAFHRQSVKIANRKKNYCWKINRVCRGTNTGEIKSRNIVEITILLLQSKMLPSGVCEAHKVDCVCVCVQTVVLVEVSANTSIIHCV